MDSNSFFVQCTGQIVSGEFGPVDYLYCRYTFSFGNDWTITSGLDTGLSQTSCKNMANSEELIIWNFPIDISFSTTNVYGWPRIAISVYGIDFMGRDVIRGYGSALIPLSSGQHQLEIDMFNPLATSYLNDFVSWMMGNPPEVRPLRTSFVTYFLYNYVMYALNFTHSSSIQSLCARAKVGKSAG